MDDIELLSTEWPEQRWAVEDLIPEGVTILAGKAKSGKSWAALSLALSVADGTPAFDRFPAEQGEVLYLALEDNPRRMQQRVRKLLSGRDRMPNGLLTIECQWPTIEEGGMEELDGWLSDHTNPRLVVIDVMRRFNPIGYSYSKDSDKIEQLGAMALRHHCAIIAVMHMYKGPGVSATTPDWMDKVQGSVGVTGAAQAIIGLSRERGSENGLLRVTGKDVQEQDVKMVYNAERGTWIAASTVDCEATVMSDERSQIFDTITANPGATAPEAAKTMGKTYNNVRHLMWAMVAQDQLKRVGAHYYTPAQCQAMKITPDPQLAFTEVPATQLVASNSNNGNSGNSRGAAA